MKFLSNRSTKPASKSAFKIACAAIACCIAASGAHAEPFIYQGQLTENNQPANGRYSMTFRLTDAAVGGLALAVDTVSNVSVIDGVFTVEIDFPSDQLNSSNRWMSINVDGVILSPRVRLRDTPRAQNAVRANSAGILETPVIMTDSSFAGIVITENTSSGQNASGLLGRVASSSPGGLSAGVRGENNGTGFSGIGVYGIHNGFGYGVYGTSPGGIGVLGNSDAGFGLWGQSDVNTGVYARTNSGPQALESFNSNADTQAYLATEDYGLLALNIETPNFGTGIRGEGGRVGVQGISQVDTQSGAQFGVWGQAGGRDINPRDVFGVYGSGQGSEIVGGRRVYGVYGVAGSGVQGNFTYGIYGTTTGPGAKGSNRFAGYFDGDVHVTGNLSKTSGSFKIDHPLDPENKYLSHSFVESPDMMNIYNGVATLNSDGAGVIELPDYFESLNRDFRYQLTAMGTPMPNLYVSEEVSTNQFSIAGGVAGARVSWEITGIRRDPGAITHPIIVEKDKPEQHKGKYLDPEAYGLSDEHAIHPKPIKN